MIQVGFFIQPISSIFQGYIHSSSVKITNEELGNEQQALSQKGKLYAETYLSEQVRCRLVCLDSYWGSIFSDNLKNFIPLDLLHTLSRQSIQEMVFHYAS